MTTSEKDTGMKKILVAYDGGAPARRALDLAAELARKLEATVAVVSVAPAHGGRTQFDPWDNMPVATAKSAEARTILAGFGIKPDVFEVIGDPATTIEQIAEDGGYDVVVVGSRGLGTVSRAVRGSVSEHIATHAAATVVVAR